MGKPEKIPDIATGITQERMLRSLTCCICGSKDCYDLVWSEHHGGLVKVTYTRSQGFVCKRCHYSFVRIDSVVTNIMVFLIRIHRRLEKWLPKRKIDAVKENASSANGSGKSGSGDTVS